MESSADLAFLEIFRRMRARFQSEVLDKSKSDHPEDADTLRQDTFYQLAEFLYAFRSYGIDSPEKLDRFVDLHNQYLIGVRDDRERMRRFGLTPERIESALFGEPGLRKLLTNFSGPDPAIDQSDLARFLATLMSTETCRKLVLASERAGFLRRVRSPFGAILVASNGIVEGIFGAMLREARIEASKLAERPLS